MWFLFPFYGLKKIPKVQCTLLGNGGLLRKVWELWPCQRRCVTGIDWTSKALHIPSEASLCLMAVGSECSCQLLLQRHVCLPTTTLPAMVVMDSNLEL